MFWSLIINVITVLFNTFAFIYMLCYKYAILNTTTKSINGNKAFDNFCSCNKTVSWKDYDITNWETNNYNMHIVRARSKGNQTMKFCPLTILTGKSCDLHNSAQEWLLGCLWPFSNVFSIHYVLYILLSLTKKYRCLKNLIQQIDSKNEWFLISASFKAKFG